MACGITLREVSAIAQVSIQRINQIESGRCSPQHRPRIINACIHAVQARIPISNNLVLLNNYILPLIGQESIQSIMPLFVDRFYSQLKKTPPVSCKTRPARSEYISEITVDKVHKLLSCAFNRAVKWELIPKNPFANSLLDKPDYNKREIWSIEDICKALDACRDDRLYLAMNLSFACSLRSGEALALTWNNVHISEREIAHDNAYIYIDKELSRISKDVMSRIDKKEG